MKLKNIICKIAALALLAFFSSAQAQLLSKDEVLAAKAEIKQLVDDYGYYRDNYDPEGYANLFSENGKFIFRGEVFQGRESLAKRMEDADKTSVSMHFMSSSHVEFVDDKTATGTHYAAIYVATPEQPIERGAMIPVSGPAVIGKYADHYVLTDDGWKISERSFTPVFNTAE